MSPDLAKLACFELLGVSPTTCSCHFHPPFSSRICLYLQVRIRTNDDHDHDDDDDDVIRILIMKSRAGQFLNMKNWDDSTNYAIPIARCDEKCALIERAEFHKKS